MRDIRFRVWEKPQEGFKGKLWTDNDPKFWASCLMNEKDEYELSQYTGLKDKNGVLIYEGDIVKTGTHKIKEIKWDTETAGYEHLNKQGMLFSQVIGNIYENPELLK